MRKLIFAIVTTVILVSVFCVQSNLSAQSASTHVEIVEATAQGINFYSTDTNGNLQIVGQLPSDFAVEGIEEGDWIIPSTDSFAVANNGEQIAFTAQNGNDVALFIYTIGEPNLQTHLIPTLGLVKWSPDSSAILIESGTQNSASSIYDIASNQLTIVPNSEGFSGGFQWLPDGNKIIFVGIANLCDAPCSSTDIYVVNRNGQELRTLTNMGSSLSSYVCAPIWNNYDKRVYYIVGCSGEGSFLTDNIYSVDLNGQVRLEENWLDLYPENFVQINGIHIAPNGSIYLAAMLTNQAGTETQWVAAQLISRQQTEIIFAMSFDGYKPLYKSKLSPQGTYLAFDGYLPQAGGGDIVVLDVLNGQAVSGSNTIEHACDIKWLNNQNLLLTQVQGWCTPDRAVGNYEAINLANIVDGTISNITTKLNAPVWLIRD